jgi:hypothetical protein
MTYPPTRIHGIMVNTQTRSVLVVNPNIDTYEIVAVLQRAASLPDFAAVYQHVFD